MSLPACRRLCGHAGSVRVAAWHQLLPSRYKGRYLSFAEREEIALHFACGRGVREIARRLGRSPRRSPGNCAATPRPGAATSSIGPPRPSGAPTGAPGGRKWPSSLRMMRCGSTSPMM